MPRLSPFGYRFLVAVLLLLGDSTLGATHRLPLVSVGLVTLPDARLGFSRAFLGRDPDGHVMLFANAETSFSKR